MQPEQEGTQTNAFLDFNQLPKCLFSAESTTTSQESKRKSTTFHSLAEDSFDSEEAPIKPPKLSLPLKFLEEDQSQDQLNSCVYSCSQLITAEGSTGNGSKNSWRRNKKKNGSSKNDGLVKDGLVRDDNYHLHCRKLFLGGIRPRTSKEEVYSAFWDAFASLGYVFYGDEFRVQIKKGYGYVCVNERLFHLIQNDVTTTPLEINTCTLYLTVASNKQDYKQKSIEEQCRKLHIVGLNECTTKAVLENYFSQFGKVEYANPVYDSMTNTPKEFGYVKFVDELVAKYLVHNKPKHLIAGQLVFLRPA